ALGSRISSSSYWASRLVPGRECPRWILLAGPLLASADVTSPARALTYGGISYVPQSIAPCRRRCFGNPLYVSPRLPVCARRRSFQLPLRLCLFPFRHQPALRRCCG